MIADVAITDTAILQRYGLCPCGRGRAPLGVLFAYPYSNGLLPKVNDLFEQGIVCRRFLDSGAYTLCAGGNRPRSIAWYSEYVEYIKANGQHFELIAAFDVDFSDPEWNQSCYQQMLMDLSGTGLEEKIVPVVHDKIDPAGEFLTYVEEGAKCIAIGSYPPIPDKEWGKINWLRLEHGVDIHMFGNLRVDVLKKKLPESIDTAQYAISAKYGGFKFWDEDKHDLLNVDVLNPKQFTDRHREYLRETFDMTSTDLLRDVTNKWLVSIDAIHQMQEYLTNEWYPEHDVAEMEIPI